MAFLLFFAIEMLVSDDSQRVTLGHAAEAHRAAIANLRSGKGEGTFKFSEQPANAAALRVKAEGKIKVFFDHSRYHVSLDYNSHHEGIERQVIIYDGSALIAASFSKLIRPVGSEAEILPIRQKELVRPRELGFPWDVRFLPSQAGNPEPIVEKIPKGSIEVTQTADGNWRFKYPLGKSSSGVFEVAPSSGFNVARLQFYSNNGQRPDQEVHATWQKKEDVWFVDSLIRTYGFEIGGGRHVTRHELKYYSFEVNPSISEKLFNIEALGLNDKSRILDRRPNAPRRQYYYYRDKTAAGTNLLILKN